MAALPYVTAPGNVERALKGIKSAATPPKVNQDFVKTILKIPGGSALGMNLGYTINLNLPATTDVAVFNAIFKSLKEHLLKDSDG
jgi:hypothetical protein